MLEIIRGVAQKPAAASELVACLQNTVEGYLYIGYPIIGSVEGRLPVDALLVSPDHGIVIFDLIEGDELGPYQERQDDAANRLEAKLRAHPQLVARRLLKVNLSTVSFGPALPAAGLYQDASYPVTNDRAHLSEILETFRSDLDAQIYHHALSALQNISTIRQARSRRTPSQQDSRGARLKRLEDTIATLDRTQSKAVIETVRGVQRIRGLAGSGKTIVLGLKAAYLHAQYPEWRIAVTFNTRSLKGQLRRHINTFCISQTGEEPDWDRLRIVNAWGASGRAERDGLYYEYCRATGAQYYDYVSAKEKFGRDTAFAGACEEALAKGVPDPALYDAILVDEAQDFPPSFLRMCYEMLTGEKNLVYAYDELQNLAGEAMAPPEHIFGTKDDGSPRVSLAEPSPSGADRDVILKVCYRNSRPVLTSAHALGFGVYREAPTGKTTGLVQMFDRPELWTDVGYEVQSGELESNHPVRLSRSPDSSPIFLEQHSEIADLVQFRSFRTVQEQTEWVVKAIQSNLQVDELRHDDIVVINPNPLTTRSAVGPIRAQLSDLNIESHIAGVTTDPDVFFTSEIPSITFTGVFRAKGNEAGMVYVINAHDCNSSGLNLLRLRNQLFTAITRSKAWVRVLGIGSAMDDLIKEFRELCARDFALEFRYPTSEERQQLAVVHRDVSGPEKRRIETKGRELEELVSALEAGQIHLEDLPDDVLRSLRRILGGSA